MNFLRRAGEPLQIVSIGEAMIEFAPVSGGLFRRGFAGDTLNTAWYLRRLLPETSQVTYVTRVGTDAVSGQFIAFVASEGIETSAISRDAERTLGLYAISLEGSERRFSYWRENSAARHLADDAGQLANSLSNAALVYLSGITTAVIGARGRANLLDALRRARAAGTRVAFDSNIRLRLWPDEKTAVSAIEQFLELTDIALPSFDDESSLWKDATPGDTAERLRKYGVAEIVVKSGPNAATVMENNRTSIVGALAVNDARDTTAAGDSFNAAYLAARCMGQTPEAACKLGHRVASEVVRHPGALAPTETIDVMRSALAASGGADQ